MQRSGTTSWLINLDEWNHDLEQALWIRAAERIQVPSGGTVPGPPDVNPLPEPSLPEPEGGAAALAAGWVWWWQTLVNRPSPIGRPAAEHMAERIRFGAPDFEGLADYPALQQVVAARWKEAVAWNSARIRAGIAAARGRHGREGDAVRAVEAEIGRAAAPFRLRIVVIPVLEEEIRPVGEQTFLVPERVRATSGYDEWLRQVVRRLA